MRTFRLTIGLAVTALALSAGEKKLMHCFTFTPVETASQVDWEAFYKATDALPGKIPGLNKVWYGKLRRSLSIYGVVDGGARKKLAAGEQKVTSEVTRTVRQYGVCMEMNNEAALQTYASDPAHKEWAEAYSKVRQPGTTTFDLIGQ